ncbi:MAG: tol-pal system protein YbgF [candidate division Zixibacteria bacterium]|nr:tol-pal system protein YbgF [candidate division Zixibacteria bacterium]
MKSRTKSTQTATLLIVAVVGVGALLPGCVTKRDIDQVNTRLDTIEIQNRRTEHLIARMDSIISAGATANDQMRTDIRVSTDELGRQIQSLLDNMNDLTSQLAKMNRTQTIKLPPTSSGQTDTASQQGSARCDGMYDDAFVLVRKGEYNSAIEGFRNFLRDCTNHQNTENAYYWIGECFYSTEKYNEAVTEFEYLLANFKNSANIGRTLYKLGRSQQEIGNKDEAKKQYQRLVKDFSGTLEAEQAKERLKDLK